MRRIGDGRQDHRDLAARGGRARRGGARRRLDRVHQVPPLGRGRRPPRPRPARRLPRRPRRRRPRARQRSSRWRRGRRTSSSAKGCCKVDPKTGEVTIVLRKQREHDRRRRLCFTQDSRRSSAKETGRPVARCSVPAVSDPEARRPASSAATWPETRPRSRRSCGATRRASTTCACGSSATPTTRPTPPRTRS